MAPTPDRIRTERHVTAMAATDTIALIAQRDRLQRVRLQTVADVTPTSS